MIHLFNELSFAPDIPVKGLVLFNFLLLPFAFLLSPFSLCTHPPTPSLLRKEGAYFALLFHGFPSAFCLSPFAFRLSP